MPAVERLESLQLLSGYQYDFSGYKFEDKNNNGYFDYKNNYEHGLKGWDIRAYKDTNNNHKLDQKEYDYGPADEDWTDKDGYYDLKLDKGNYIIVEVQQDGWDQTAPDKKVLSYNLDTYKETLGDYGYSAYVKKDSYYNNFGNHKHEKEKFVYKSGTKYEDMNANGAFDTGDTPLAGWKIDAYVDKNYDGKLNDGDYLYTYDTTDSNGDYSLKLKKGVQYIVVEELQDDYFQSSPAAGSGLVSVNTSNADLGQYGYVVKLYYNESGNDFFNFRQATKSGVKFLDKNANGTRDAGDTGLGGWTIRAYRDTNGNNLLDTGDTLAATTTTAANTGAYSFTLNPGTYIIVEVSQATWIQSYPTNNVLSPTNPVTGVGQGGWVVTLTSHATDTDNNFGNYQNATISGQKFYDKDYDGKKDYYEKGLEGWTIRAYVDANHNDLLDQAEYDAGPAYSTVTDSDGNYTLSVKPNDYIIVEVLQKNWKQTYPHDEVLGDIDFDNYERLGKFGYNKTVTSGQSLSGKDFGNFYKKRDKHDKDHDHHHNDWWY